MKEIVVYTQPGIELDITNKRFFSSKKTDLSLLNRDLSRFEFVMSPLGGQQQSELVKSAENQQVFILCTSTHAEEIIDYLLEHDAVFQSAYIKPPAEQP